MTDGLLPYPAYKDSGVPWLGRVPAHWKLNRLKNWTAVNARVLSESTPPDYCFRYVDIGSVTRGMLSKSPQEMRFGVAPSRARRLVGLGDTIISTVRTYLKAVYTYEGGLDPLIASTGFAVLTPREGANPHFIGYVAQSAAFIDRLTAESVGIAYPAVSETKLGNLMVALPPLDEQAAIVRFLDHANAKVERAVRAKRKLIALLTEQKQAIIHRAVTRGLDPAATLKPSGIPWVGDVPAGWEVRRISHLFTERNERGRPGLPVFAVSLRTGVTEGATYDVDGTEKRFISDVAMYNFADRDDIAYNMMRMWQGRLV